MAESLWVREIKRNRIVRDIVVLCPERGWEDAMVAACRALDIGVPMLVEKHRRDFEQFNQLRFLPEHFLETVPFDRLEAEYFDPEERPKRAHPPSAD